jgi:hypothetical protein
MKRILIGLAVLAFACWPAMSHAQYNEGEQNPNQYNDVEDGQALKVIAYLLTPVGMGLEWGLTRPLHYVATQTSAGVLIAGDTESSYFGQSNNADLLPPGTFDPHVMTGQYTNYTIPASAIGAYTSTPATAPPAQQITLPSAAPSVSLPSGQPGMVR